MLKVKYVKGVNGLLPAGGLLNTINGDFLEYFGVLKRLFN
jgi:hypothetical protein